MRDRVRRRVRRMKTDSLARASKVGCQAKRRRTQPDGEIQQKNKKTPRDSNLRLFATRDLGRAVEQNDSHITDGPTSWPFGRSSPASLAAMPMRRCSNRQRVWPASLWLYDFAVPKKQPRPKYWNKFCVVVRPVYVAQPTSTVHTSQFRRVIAAQ